MYLSYDELKSRAACSQSLMIFKELFGDRMEITKSNLVKFNVEYKFSAIHFSDEIEDLCYMRKAAFKTVKESITYCHGTSCQKCFLGRTDWDELVHRLEDSLK